MPGPLSSAVRRRWHRLVEHYTPDGWFGRLLLGLIAGSASVTLLAMTVFGLTHPGPLALLGAVLTGPLGLASGLIAVVTLWPVYLSLIGNVESAAAYAETGAAPPPESVGGTDPAELLKRRYAAGEISKSEFDRRLDDLFDAETGRRGTERPGDGETRDRIVERE